MLASSACLYNKEWRKKKKKARNRRGLADGNGRAVSDGSTATPCGKMTTLHVRGEIGTLHLLLK